MARWAVPEMPETPRPGTRHGVNPDSLLFTRGLCTIQYYSWHSTPPLLHTPLRWTLQSIVRNLWSAPPPVLPFTTKYWQWQYREKAGLRVNPLKPSQQPL